MSIGRTLLVLLGVTIAACSDSPTEPTIGASGSLSFSYTGAGAASGTQYSATGAIPVNVAINNGSSAWAAAFVDSPNNATSVWASVPKSGTTWDMTFIEINRTTPGTSTIDVNCSDDCTEIAVWFGTNNNQTNYTYLCALTSGTVNVSAISSTNVTGTFSGGGTCHASTGGDTPFTVTGGTFNVGVTTALQ